MDHPLAPCPSCRRHIRITEDACPFCSVALESAELARGAVPGSSQRLTRAAMFVFGATLATSPAGCDGDTQNPTGAQGSVTGTGTGAAGASGTGASDAGGEGGAPVPLYGGPGPGPGGSGQGGEGGVSATGGQGGQGGAGGASGGAGGEGVGGNIQPPYGAAPRPDEE